jgi:PEP-CTERM motif
MALIVGGWALAGSREAGASPIKGSHERSEEARIDAVAAHSWAAYLKAGPSVWSSLVHPSVTPDVRTSIWRALRSDDAESSAWVQFLLWKQSLDPARFAHYHPKVAPVLDRISSASLGSQAITPATTPPTSSNQSTTTPLTQSQTLTGAVPEPGAWLLALGMTGWGLWWRRRGR